MVLFDAHLHFSDPAAAPDWGATCCGTHPAQWASVLGWAKHEARIRPCLGMHPWWLPRAEPGWEETLNGLLTASHAGVGECGMDAAMRNADLEAQVEALRVHLRLARALDRPLVLHVVRAWGRLEALLRTEAWPTRVMIHAFSGSADTAKALQKRGITLSFAPMGHRSPRIREALRGADPALLLLETDAENPRDQAAFPAWIQVAAACRREDPEVLASRCAAHARDWFRGVSA